MVLIRYIFQHQLQQILLVVAVISTLLLLGQFMEYGDKIDTLPTLAKVVFLLDKTLLQLGKIWSFIIVIGTFWGVLKLRQTNQLQALRCQGLSQLRIINICSIAAISLSLLHIVATEFYKSWQSNPSKMYQNYNSIWSPFKHGYYYLSNITIDGEANDVYIWQRSKANSHIDQLVYIPTMKFNASKQWQFDRAEQIHFADPSNLVKTAVNTIELPHLSQLLLQQKNINEIPITQLITYNLSHNRTHFIQITNIIISALFAPILVYFLVFFCGAFCFKSNRDVGANRFAAIGVCIAIFTFFSFILLKFVINIYLLNPFIYYAGFLFLLYFSSKQIKLWTFN